MASQAGIDCIMRKCDRIGLRGAEIVGKYILFGWADKSSFGNGGTIESHSVIGAHDDTSVNGIFTG